MANARRLFRIGNSTAITIPPHILEHIHAALGDFVVFNTTYKDNIIIAKVPLPPQLSLPIDESIDVPPVPTPSITPAQDAQDPGTPSGPPPSLDGGPIDDQSDQG